MTWDIARAKFQSVSGDLRDLVRHPQVKLGYLGTFLFVAVGVGALNSPVHAEGCTDVRQVSVQDVRNASLTIRDQAIDGSVVDIVATARGGVDSFVLAYSSEGKAGPVLRTISVGSDKISLCEDADGLIVDVDLSTSGLDLLREVAIGFSGEAKTQFVTTLYHPAQVSLAALSLWHEEQVDSWVELNLFRVGDGLRVGAIKTSEDGTAAPQAFWKVALPDHDLHRVSLPI